MCVGVICVLILTCTSALTFIFQTYSVRRVEMGESRSVYVTLAFAGVALMVSWVVHLLFSPTLLNRRWPCWSGSLCWGRDQAGSRATRWHYFSIFEKPIFNPHKLPQEPCYDFPQEHSHNFSHQQSIVVKSNLSSILTSTTRGVLLSILEEILESYLENTSLGMLLTLAISINLILSQSSSTQQNTHTTQNTRNQCKAKKLDAAKQQHCLNLNDSDSGHFNLLIRKVDLSSGSFPFLSLTRPPPYYHRILWKYLQKDTSVCIHHSDVQCR